MSGKIRCTCCYVLRSIGDIKISSNGTPYCERCIVWVEEELKASRRIRRASKKKSKVGGQDESV